MKYPATFKRYIRNVCNQLRIQFFCGEFELEIKFEDEKDHVVAAIRSDFKYLRLTVFVHPPVLRMYRANEFKEIGEALTHEFSHILTDPIYFIAIDAVNNSTQKFLEETRERQTQRIANIIFPNIPKRIYIPTKLGPAKKNH